MRNSLKGLSLVLGLVFGSCTAKEKPIVKEEFKEPVKIKVKEGMEVATFAGGCFWCTEAVFLEIKGVDKVVSGYIGGTTKNPTYKDICTGETGHAEAIQITFNPNEVAYEDLLEVFFATHDPTTLNRQGADVGTQYRSEIFYHSEAQKTKVENYIQLLEKEKLYDKKIVTKVSSASVFYNAEEYHQNYYNQNSSQGYCQMVIAPKLEKLRKYYKSKLK
ncbi:peptide-methionine (S)-S-oxide reductase [Flavobacterium cheniae]|uniref:Peptide methionine sulfoxide reductase MsrA n=2 Tax=Flavobacterium cheniae TaxID=295428 RepID=A0A562KF53_9FLAO|nr:peptide-methionine (S)-S-oxide reductase [Flavobacterium cheniae]TWH93885.1 peptide-methionine (S)-S-oxide reductase [Flavobacterium cheniae]